MRVWQSPSPAAWSRESVDPMEHRSSWHSISWSHERARACFLGDPNDELDIWTIQEREVLEALRVSKRFLCEWSRVDSDYLEAYRWIAGEVELRVGGSLDWAPIWGWLAWMPPEFVRPDLRFQGHLPSGTLGVRVHLRVPRRHLVPSWFHAWHCVLNGQEVMTADDGRPACVGAVRRSWMKIFDWELPVALWGQARARSIQCCLPEIRGEWVRGTTEFRAR